MVSERTEAALAAVARDLGTLADPDHPLGPHTTYRVGGPAALFVEITTADDLAALRAALAGRAVPILVVGRGSNLLVADRGFAGLVVHLGEQFASIDMPTPGDDGGPDHTAVVRAGGAVALPVLARRTVEAGCSGLEWAVGVPGSVGGAVRMNAGGHGSDTAARLVRYSWVDLASAREGIDGFERLAYGYRRSSLTATELVLWAEFTLDMVPEEAIENGRATLAEIVRWRRANQPGGANAGSVFTNPPGDSAGRLVQEAGLKGYRLGTAHVSEKHANFIQADDSGSADDVMALIDRVRQTVAERTGVTLETEVRLIGFDGVETGAVPTNPEASS